MASIRTEPTSRTADRWQHRLTELGISWSWARRRMTLSPQRIAAAYEERIKELNCLYAISQLAQRDELSLSEFLDAMVEVLPASWQFPEVACAIISTRRSRHESLFFEDSRWKLSAPIVVHGEQEGRVTVHYTERRPPADEGPFLREERQLLDAVAERIGHVAERRAAEAATRDAARKLKRERNALQEANNALRAVLGQFRDEKAAGTVAVREKVQRVVMPRLQKLACRVSPLDRVLVREVMDDLNRIALPIDRRLSTTNPSLTPHELKICAMIRDGLASKEIAEMCGISVATVSRHRENIRRKLGLGHTGTNLASFLQNSS